MLGKSRLSSCLFGEHHDFSSLDEGPGPNRVSCGARAILATEGITFDDRGARLHGAVNGGDVTGLKHDDLTRSGARSMGGVDSGESFASLRHAKPRASVVFGTRRQQDFKEPSAEERSRDPESRFGRFRKELRAGRDCREQRWPS
jgi:hypothetical protein